MFQSFEVKSAPQFGRDRVSALRAKFADLGIDGFLIPRADEYQGEYVPASAERLSWLTGFTGSAGMALITQREAIVFVDGRYVTQLAEQVDGSMFAAGDLVNEPPHVWLPRHGARGFRLGIDPWLHAGAEVRRLEKALAEIGGSLVLLDANPLDAIWSDRPAEPLGAVSIQKQEHAGTLAGEKIGAIASQVKEKGAAAVVIADPTSVAWIFNIRGDDVPHTPYPLSRAIIPAEGKAEIFLDQMKTGIEQAAYLAQIAVQRPPSEFLARLAAFSADGAKILIDPELTPLALTKAITAAGGEVVEASDPAKLPRACKNREELDGSAKAHLQDGAAMVEYLCWLDAQAPATITEIDAVKALEATRARVGQNMQNPLKDISFDTISGAGEHGAVIHYRVTTETNRKLEAGELFLVDSGAQYVNGTTDITRTVAVGAVPEEQKKFFTLVLKGMIGISTLRFPAGTRGSEIDAVARMALWKHGCDFAHGTGHGVGSYLAVHEGPQRIARTGTEKLLAGMMLSNEPGYYKEGAYGIRIENLILVTPAEPIEGGDIAMHGFETLTLAPIDKRLIRTDLLHRDELQWLDRYHARVLAEIGPMVDGETLAWLEKATAPLPHDAKI
jgi:Xaa-Pro aminopeptidase